MTYFNEVIYIKYLDQLALVTGYIKRVKIGKKVDIDIRIDIWLDNYRVYNKQYPLSDEYIYLGPL